VALRLSGTPSTPRTSATPHGSSSRWVASRRPGSSRGSGCRSSACGPGTRSPSFPPSWCCCRRGCRSTSTTSRAGRARRSWALSVVCAHRPVHDLDFGIDELRTGVVEHHPRSLRSWSGRFDELDRLLHRYERRPIRWLRRIALRRAEGWILQRQEADGSWGGIQPPWVYSLIALHEQGYALEHPALRAGIEGLDGFTIEDDMGRRIEACPVPRLGHGAHGVRARRRGLRSRRSRLGDCSSVPPPRRGRGAWRLVRAPPRARARRWLVLRVRERQLPRRRRLS